MRSSSLRVVAAIVAVLCCTPALAQRAVSHIAPGEAAPVTVRARVVGPDGAPVAGAMVFTDAGGSGISDARGEVTFTIEQRLDRLGARVTAVGLIGTENGVGGAGARLADGELDAGTITLQLDGECRPAWLPMFGGMPAGPNAHITAVVAFDDGSGPAVYIAGDFTRAGQEQAIEVAKWDGERWSAVGDLGFNDGVFELKVFDLGDGPRLYAGGFFRQLGDVEDSGVARWTGETWEAVGEGLEASFGRRFSGACGRSR